MRSKSATGSVEGIQAFQLDQALQVENAQYLLGTTYTLSLAFFESVVFPNLGRTTLRKSVILCDGFGFRRAIDEAPALEGAGQDYIVEPISERCLHAKVWMVIGEREAILLVGSGNLTKSGFMTNAELFDVLRFSAENPMSKEMHRAVQSFLNGLTDLLGNAATIAAETISEIAAALADFGSDRAAADADPQFVNSFD